MAASQQPPPKRQKPSESGAAADPARAYCLAKFQDIFSGIFSKYPNAAGDEAEGEQSASPPSDKKSEELTDDEKTQVDQNAKAFAIEVEQSIYDIYSEADVKGKVTVGPKYKYVSSFYLLNENLIHCGIISGNDFVCLCSILQNLIESFCINASQLQKYYPENFP